MMGEMNYYAKIYEKIEEFKLSQGIVNVLHDLEEAYPYMCNLRYTLVLMNDSVGMCMNIGIYFQPTPTGEKI